MPSRLADDREMQALVNAMVGVLPTNSEIELLGKVFGEDFAKALRGKRSLGAKAWENFVDAANLPRALMTAWDASAPLRSFWSSRSLAAPRLGRPRPSRRAKISRRRPFLLLRQSSRRAASLLL